MNFETLLYELKEHTAHITLNRPDKMNTVNIKMFEELIQAVALAEEDDEVKVVVFKGAGRCFSAGADLEMVYAVYSGKEKTTRRPSQRARLHRDRKFLETLRRILYCWKPTIAQVHGHAIGVGLYIVQACEMALAAEDAKLGHPEQRLAFGGATFMLINEFFQVGLKKARELLLTGRLIDGREAERIGMVNYAVPMDRLEAEVKRFADGIALMPRDALAIGKAQTFLAYDAMGLGTNINQAILGHTMATNIRFEEDEYNFIRARRDKGAREGFHKRDERWSKLGF